MCPNGKLVKRWPITRYFVGIEFREFRLAMTTVIPNLRLFVLGQLSPRVHASGWWDSFERTFPVTMTNPLCVLTNVSPWPYKSIGCQAAGKLVSESGTILLVYRSDQSDAEKRKSILSQMSNSVRLLSVTNYPSASHFTISSNPACAWSAKQWNWLVKISGTFRLFWEQLCTCSTVNTVVKQRWISVWSQALCGEGTICDCLAEPEFRRVHCSSHRCG